MTYRRVVSEDPLDRMFQGGRAKLGLERNSPVADETSIVVPPTYRPLAGLRQNMRGNSIVVVPGSTEPNVLMCRSPGDDAEVLALTLGLELEGRDPDFSINGTNPIQITANLEWGIGNATFTAQCDWRWGTTLQINANFLRVGASYAYNPSIGANTTNVRLSAAVGYGQVTRNSNLARLTQQVTSINGTTTALAAGVTSDPMRIPNFATSVSVLSAVGAAPLGTLLPATPMVVQQTGTIDSNTVQTAHRYSSGNNTAWNDEGAFPIINGARYIYVKNDSMANIPASSVFGGGVYLLYGLGL